MVRNTLFLALTSVLVSNVSIAQDAPAPEPAAKKVGQVIVTGTRVQNRTVAESSAPIDVISPAALEATGTTELATALSRALPSLNFPRPAITDGTDAVRPAQLRGLAPDQVLILINGKRMHTTAMLNLNGSQGRGSSPADLNTIPIAAVERVEVLRDGASAQYGSDAIAGVVNVVLKGSGSGGGVGLRVGQYKEGDGDSAQLTGDSGFRFADGQGTVHVAAQILRNDQTNRARAFIGPQTPTSAPTDRVVQRFGDPEIHQNALSYSARFNVSEAMTGYSFATFAYRNALSNGYFRPAGDSRNIPSIYPNGFLPQIRNRTKDQTIVFGVRGQTIGDTRYDVSYNHGRSYISFGVENSLNRSIGPTSPTKFFAGDLDLKQTVFNIDLSNQIGIGLELPLSVAYGIEYRTERFDQGPGDVASYINGGVRINGAPAPSGSQVYPGFRPSDAGQFFRHSHAGYIDFEANPFDALTLGLAGRFEKFSDFGSTSSGKLSARYEFSPAIAMRGTYSTGFRAPSLQQQYFQSTSTNFISVAGVGSVPFEIRTFRVNDPAAIALGAEKLRPEESKNASLGLVLQTNGGLYVTLDAYQIQVKDRIVLSENLTSAAVRTYLNTHGFPDVGGGRYFTNAIDTTTRGFDIVGTYRTKLATSSIDWTVGYNRNKTSIDRIAANPASLMAIDPNALRFGRTEVGRLVVGSPRDKFSANAIFRTGPFTFSAMATRYGEFTVRGATTALDQTFSAKWLGDLSAGYKFGAFDFTVGADNVFDTYPDEVILANSTGGQLPYSGSSPFGFNGAFYWAKLGYSWK